MTILCSLACSDPFLTNYARYTPCTSRDDGEENDNRSGQRLSNIAGRRGCRSFKVLREGSQPESQEPTPIGRVPRISKLMALAIRFDRLIREGEITDQPELAQVKVVDGGLVAS